MAGRRCTKCRRPLLPSSPHYGESVGPDCWRKTHPPARRAAAVRVVVPRPRLRDLPDQLAFELDEEGEGL